MLTPEFEKQPVTQLISQPKKPLNGTVQVPGDKSISHRALMLSGLAVGRSEVRGLLEGEDVLATASAMRAMGATVNRLGDGHYEIYGVGVGGLLEPEIHLDMGNSGTSTRLLLGLMATHDLTATVTGDASLSKRPMGRVIDPLTEFGASFSARTGGRLPLTIKGTPDPLPLDYTTPMASAQVKSAVLLAGLNTPGITTVREAVATRDHSERMLRAMGANIETSYEGGHYVVRLAGQPELNPLDLDVPGDISSAAFVLAAAAMVQGSDIMVEGVGLNPLRTGIIAALQALGANITVQNERMLGGEPVGDIRVEAAQLKGTSELHVDPSTMIDEFPVLFCAAASADGVSHFSGLKELRVKESDRLSVMAAGLRANGVQVEEEEDGIIIHGRSGFVPGGGTVETHLDHRIAMSFAVLGQVAKTPITIDDASPINTSFPGFIALMQTLGAGVKLVD